MDEEIAAPPIAEEHIDQDQDLTPEMIKLALDSALIGVCEIVLTTGHHIVAEVYPPIKSTFMLRYPTTYQFFRNEDGHQYIAFFKYMTLSEESKLFIHASNCVAFSPVSDEYRDSYYKAVNHYFEIPHDSNTEEEKSNVINLKDWLPKDPEKAN